MEKLKVRRTARTTGLFLVFLVIFSFAGFTLRAESAEGSIEIWPAERQADGIAYIYGGDWNFISVQMRSERSPWGRHRIELPERFTEKTVLEMTLPVSVEFLGAASWHRARANPDAEITLITRGGKPCQRVDIVLCNDMLNDRLFRWYAPCDFQVWFDAPETLDDELSYRLLHGGEELARGGCRLVTAGVVRADRPMPERFGFYPWRIWTSVPGDDYDRWAGFLSRMGIRGMKANVSAEPGGPMREMMEANRRHGIKNIAHMTHFVTRHGGPGYTARREETMARGGLVKLMDELCAGLESEEARVEWEKICEHGLYDTAKWNWEPTGPDRWPGYDDEATIFAFKQAKGITEEITVELLRARYGREYSRFREEQIARPLFSLAEMMNSVQPMHFRVEAGGGAYRVVDYEIYDSIADAHSPMIYQRTPLRYARDLLEMLESTSVPAEKFWPDLTIGWHRVGVYRNSPQELLMDTVVTAAAGCGSISHWPSLFQTDALLFGVYEGMARIAPVEDFYLDGERADGVEMEGIPYREETVQLGYRRLEVMAPDWRDTLITFAHRLGREYALTFLNYHDSEDAFVRINARELRNMYLVNPHEGAWQQFDGRGRAVVEVGAASPGIWIATRDRGRVSGCRMVEAGEIEARLNAAREAFLREDRAGKVELGTAGDVTVEYGLTEFGGEERMTLNVSTPHQKLMFGSSGGRIYGWDIEGMENFVCRRSFATSGMGKDLFWLPEHARWSGDETAEYTLVASSNDGREARVVYEGEFKNALPGISVRKLYRVPAEGTSLRLEITLRNDTFEQTPVELSYWSHNTLSGGRAYFIGENLIHETGRRENTVFTARGLEEELRSLVVEPRNIAGETGPAHAEYFPEAGSGIIFRLPEVFMNVYRWSGSEERQSSEWMSVPLSIPAGLEVTLGYTMTAVPEATAEGLREALSEQAADAAGDADIFPYDFRALDEEGMPAGWRIRKGGDNADSAGISAVTDEAGEAMMKVELPLEASVFIDSPRFRIDPARDYMVVVEMKVEDMRYTGGWYDGGPVRGIMMMLHGINTHTWMVVCGEGSTDGWVTVVLPFPIGDEERRQKFERSNLLLRCQNMTGTVYLKSPVIIKQPAGADITRSFEMEDGTRVQHSFMRLSP